jgi:Fe-S cluster biosynthesis and repair protein YggX
MANRMVQCAKFRRELPGLDQPPYPGEIGQRIYENISRMAWEMWERQATLLINHYGLNMADPRAQNFLLEQLELFLFSDEGAMPEGWTPEDQGGGKGAPTKGAPAPQRK